MNLVKAVTKSGNRKLGDASTTHAAQISCPDSCIFKDGGGCYAERGPLGYFVLRNLNDSAVTMEATALDVARAEAIAIDEMDTVIGRPIRLHTVGDCASDEAALLVSQAAERYMDRGGGQAWTYTHAWRVVNRESWGRVSVLASCETDEEVREAKARGYATAIVVDQYEQEKLYRHGETDILPCPAQTRKGEVTCSSCRLCFDDEGLRKRDYSIGFAVHGDQATKKRAHERLRSTAGGPQGKESP